MNPSPQGISQLVAVGVNAAQPSDLPSYIVFDRDYLHGELDTVIPCSTAVELAEAIPGARLVVIPGAGHASNQHKPEESHA